MLRQAHNFQSIVDGNPWLRARCRWSKNKTNQDPVLRLCQFFFFFFQHWWTCYFSSTILIDCCHYFGITSPTLSSNAFCYLSPCEHVLPVVSQIFISQHPCCTVGFSNPRFRHEVDLLGQVSNRGDIRGRWTTQKWFLPVGCPKQFEPDQTVHWKRIGTDFSM